jgi:hypothetical protein
MIGREQARGTGIDVVKETPTDVATYWSFIRERGAVSGDIEACANFTCGSVAGDVDAGGNVISGGVRGDIDAGANVTYGDTGRSILVPERNNLGITTQQLAERID